MLPTERYQIRRAAKVVRGGWYIVDVQSRATVVSDLPTEAAARAYKTGMCIAWWDGANGVKNGEVIL